MPKRSAAVPNLSARLIQTAALLDTCATLDAKLAALVQQTAESLDAAQCSIMLYMSSDADERYLQVSASHGVLPEAAYAQRVAAGEGIAGRVAADGVALLIEDITHSPYAKLARREASTNRSLMVAPVSVDRQIIGVINVTHPLHAAAFVPADLDQLKVLALFAGKTIQVMQLQNLLNSRFARMALAQQTDAPASSAALAQACDPNKMARIIAKSFFREMTQAGFGANQIIQTASEIISLLSGTLQKHSKRRDKE